MKTNLQKSFGQGHQSSKLEHNIFKNNSSSIVSRLHSRTLTGRNLQIQIHQHFGYRLHMVWKTKNQKQSSERYLQRMITMTNEMDKFLQELISGGSENLCNCVGEKFPEILEGKVEKCFRAHSTKRNVSKNITDLGSGRWKSVIKKNFGVLVTPTLHMYMGWIGKYLTKIKISLSLFSQNEDKLQ
jgi:hypothetical protein